MRYALDHIQFKGSTGEVVASDSKQLLIQGGFTFPWQDDVLVSRIGAHGVVVRHFRRFLAKDIAKGVFCPSCGNCNRIHRQGVAP